MDVIKEFKQELEEMDMSLWSDVEIVDPDTGLVIAEAGENVTEENIDRVLYLVLVDDASIWTIIDGGIYVASELG